MAFRVIHYINQFFGGIGGEEKADIAPELREGIVGPGAAFKAAFKGEAEIVATVICGDNYYAANSEAVIAFVLDAVKKYNADGLVSGPAFNAGRYGMAAGGVAAGVAKTGLPTLSGMFPENPGVELSKSGTYIIPTSDSAAGMKTAVPAMAGLFLKLLKKESLGTAETEGYIERGVRINMFYDEVGAERAVAMLVKKIKGEAFTTEYKMPVFDRVVPRPGVKDMTKTKIALVTSGGIVPKGNPDHIAASSAKNYGEYDITGVTDLTEATYQTAHGGYDQTYANIDADRVLPVDVLRDLEKEGKIGSLHKFFYSTVGNGTAVTSAKQWGTEIGQKLRNAQVQAVILTST
jgi:betaine reductase